MPAISCHSCHKLISDQETHCPFCNAPQRLERQSGQLSKRAFTDPTAVITWIIGINVLLYIASVLLTPSSADVLWDTGLDFLAIGSPDSKALYLLGMTGGSAWRCGHYWTIITASFLHGSLLHIFFNLSALRTLAFITVHFLGPARFVVVYLLTGAFGFLLSNLWTNSPTIGASCSIFGLLGVLASFSKRRGGVIGTNLNRQIWAWIIVGLAFGFVIPHINNAGHIGGLISGYLLGYLLPKQEGTRESGPLQLSALIILGLSLLCFGWNSMIMLSIDFGPIYQATGQFFCR